MFCGSVEKLSSILPTILGLNDNSLALLATGVRSAHTLIALLQSLDLCKNGLEVFNGEIEPQRVADGGTT